MDYSRARQKHDSKDEPEGRRREVSKQHDGAEFASVGLVFRRVEVESGFLALPFGARGRRALAFGAANYLQRAQPGIKKLHAEVIDSEGHSAERVLVAFDGCDESLDGELLLIGVLGRCWACLLGG